MNDPTSRLARLPIYYGWVAVAIAFVTLGVGVSVRTSFSLLYPPILDEFGWDRGTTAAAFSIGFISSTVFSPIVGVLMDRFGPRLVIPVGAVMVAAGLVLATYGTTPWHLYLTLGVLVVGGSVFVSYIGHSMFLPNWFVRRRGLAIGLAFAGVGVGAIVMFPWLQAYIAVSGWRAACIAMAVLMLVAVVPLNAALQRRRPEDIGLEPDGGNGRRAGAGGVPHSNIVDREWAERDWTLKAAMATSRFWWCFVAYFAGLYVWYAVQVHQTKYLIDIGFSAVTAAYALGLVGLGGIAGQIGIGWLSDRIGREMAWTVSAAGYVICYLSLLALGVVPSTVLMYVMVLSQGLLGYGVASIYGAIPAELFQGPRFGTIFGVLTLGGAFGAGVGPWLTGYIHDQTGSYAIAFWIGVVLSIVCAVCIWLAAPRKVRLVGGLAERRARAEAGGTSA